MRPPEEAGGRPDLRLDSREKVLVAVLFGGIVATTLVAFVLAFTVGAQLALPTSSRQYAVTFGGLAVLMYVFGLRHGVDADHIAAIDNTTRKLLHERKRPLTVGTWFSLGHSTIVVGMILALIAATQFIESRIANFQAVGAVVGTSVSGTFLVVIGLINVVVVLEVYRIFRGLRRGTYREGELDAQLNQRGFMSRYFGRLFRIVSAPWQIYPIGVLFGLGFDTASELVLIAVAAGVGLGGAPLWAVLVLPLMFLCGMVLVDTTDGVAMRYAYGWAFLRPIRKIYYNLTITIISVLVAFLIGGVELLQVLSGELGLKGGFWSWLAAVDLETLGYLIVALFVGSWLVALAIYRWRRMEEIGAAPTAPPVGGG